MQCEAPDAIDKLQGQLPPFLKWCLMSAGAATGWYYARTDATPIPLSYIALGAVAGFFLVETLFYGLRVLKVAVVCGLLLLACNYAVLVPFGYGDHLGAWVALGKVVVRSLDPSPLIVKWGKNPELRP